MRQKNLRLLLAGMLLSITLSATDNAHFYKSANLHRNPSTCWFDDEKYYEIEDWYLKVEDNMMYGYANSAWDKNGSSTNVLNRTGAFDMREAGQNVNLATIAPLYRGIIQNLMGNGAVNNAVVPNDSNDYKLQFDGKFEMWESDYQVRKNLIKGFFVETRIPVRSLKVKNISYTDLSSGVQAADAQWQQFKNNLDGILDQVGYKAYNAEFSKIGLGDMSFLVGWQDIFEHKDNNGDDNYTLNVATRLGILAPTGERVKNDYIFAMPTGYNNHWGLTGSLDLDLEVLSWLDLGFYGGFTWFFDNNRREMRLKSSATQQGNIIFAKGIAKEDKGTLWYLGTDVKFDHFWKGLSGIIGYSYNRQEADQITPDDLARFPQAAIDTDSNYDGFYSHVFHFMFDYDISIHLDAAKKWAPRVNVFCNLPFDGKNTFKTNTFGLGLGVDMKW